MRRLLLLAMFAALPALADGYSFHLRVTDGKKALFANPSGAPPEMTLEAAAKTRVLLFERVEGAHFKWLMVSWPEEKADVRWAINAHGGVATDHLHNADLVLAPQESGLVVTRCERAKCFIHITANERRVDATLTKGLSADLPLDADWDVEFQP